MVSVTGHDAGCETGDVIVAADPRFRPAEAETAGRPVQKRMRNWAGKTGNHPVGDGLRDGGERSGGREKHSLLKSHGYEAAIALES